MEGISPILAPNTAVATYTGLWLVRKKRTWQQRLGASTLPFLLIVILTFYYSYYTSRLSAEIFFERILIYWAAYLLLTWSWPFIYLCKDVDIRRLKSSAIKNLGWIAGNASGIASWQSRVGENSKYYRALTDAGNEDARLSADLYYTWKKQGENEPYNEKKCKKLYKKAGKKIKKADSYMKGSVSKISIQNAD
ncbi:MAG: hypothetical protein R6U97_06985 [Desulfosalsimonas sp.]